MLDSKHPDLELYKRGPEAFHQQVYRDISAAYSSLYGDDTDGIVVALKRIEEGLHEGYTAAQMVEKTRQAAAETVQKYRSKVSVFIRTRPWTKQFKAVTKIEPATAATPYTGPMPKRP